MLFDNATLRQVLKDMGDSDLAEERAMAGNFMLEERLGPARIAGYEKDFIPATPTPKALHIAHNAYLENKIWIELPETFLPVNADAASSAGLSGLGDSQTLVRVEMLDFALSKALFGSLDHLDRCVRVYHEGAADPVLSKTMAAEVLDKVCASLNANPNAQRPRFAAFEEELGELVAAPDWAEKLRDRLGLAHIQPTDALPSFPVALMRYSVGEVKARARKLRASQGLAVPTVLDAKMCEVFHPAPCEAEYGRTLNLGGNPECDAMASEVLTLRIDYDRSHLIKVGTVNLLNSPEGDVLDELRREHLMCLQLNVRDDFGTV